MDQTTMEVIKEKVTVVALLADNARKGIEKRMREMQTIVDTMVTRVEGKIDREFVERVFNKFREVLSDMNERIDNVQCSFLEWVTCNELNLVLEYFLGVVSDIKDTAATWTKYCCLFCGRKREHLAGMMISRRTDDLAPAEPQRAKRYPDPE